MGYLCRHRGDKEESFSIAFTNICFCPAGKIPEEAKALSLLAPATPVPSLIPGGGLLPIPAPAPLQNVSLATVIILVCLLFMQVNHNIQLHVIR